MADNISYFCREQNTHMPTPIKLIILTAILVLSTFTSWSQALVKPPFTQKSWTKDFKPFRIAGNLYYVGTYDLACYLITTPQGHILINTGIDGSMPMIRKHIEKLGFKFSDIKILLTTHVHFDHVGDMAAIKKATGAQMMINEYDTAVAADGGKSDYIFGSMVGASFQPFTVDRVLHDHDTVQLGGMKIIMLHHPGHTKGACSYIFDVKDEIRSYRVLIANMPSILDEADLAGMPAYPNIAKDYGYTLDALKKLQFDIWLASHASQFGLHEKRKHVHGYRPEVFIDRKGYDEAIDNLQKKYQEKLRKK